MAWSNWLEPRPVTVSDALRQAVGGHPLVAEILARRGFDRPEAALAFLDSERYVPAPPHELPGVTQAAALLTDALRQGRRIAVWGDFDVDGQTATSLLVDALRDLGGDPGYYIPHRIDEGHGIKLPALQALLDTGIDLLLTCDTGVGEFEAIDVARAHGVQVIVTDHHDLPPELPHVEALVEPKLLPIDHPLRELPGVGVAYKLAQALYATAGRSAAADRLLDLVALGIVADVARQVGDTRYLLQRGLRVLRTSNRAGLQALMAQAELDPLRVDAETIGFQLGPRLNALGRLANATQAVELLTTTDRTTARLLAAQLEGLNNERKLLCDQVEAAAQELLVKEPALLDSALLLLVQPHWHPGVLGIVANRLAEQYRRPAGLLTITPEGLARGSLRSVPGVDLGAALAANADLLVRFGGHAGAAGLTIDPTRVPELRRVLSNTIEATRAPDVDAHALVVDAVVPLGELSLGLAQALDRLAPFGEGNPPVTLVSHGVTVQTSRLIGRSRRHRRLGLVDAQGTPRVAVWWGGADAELPEGVLDVAYTLGQNEYRGEVTLQLSMQAVRLQAPAVVAAAPPPAITVIDLRAADDALAAVRELLTGPDSWQVWAEGQAPPDIPTRTRQTLLAQTGLIVWSAPPSRHELTRALQRATPGQVALVNRVTTTDRLDGFLRDLLGMVKFALARRKGELHIPAMAAGLGQREVTVRRGLAWLEANAHIQVVTWVTGDRLLVAAGHGTVSQPASLILAQAELHALLAEAAAFRAFCHRAPAESLLEDT